MNTPASRYRFTALDLAYVAALRGRWGLNSDANTLREALRRAAAAEKLEIRPPESHSVATTARGMQRKKA